MEIPNGIQTAALIAGTVITASGLNLGVIGLGESSVPEEVAANAAKPTAAGDVSADEGAPMADGDPLVLAAAPLGQTLDDAGEPASPGLPVASPPPASPPAAAGAPATSGSAAPAQAAEPPVQPAGVQPAAQPSTAQPSSAQPQPPSPPAPAPAPTRPATQASNPQSSPPATPAPTQPSVQPPTSPSTQPSTQPPTQPPVVQTEYLTYEFAGIADIVVALHDGDRLEFWSAVKAPGWVSRVDDNGPGNVKVKFMRLSDGEEAEFEVKLTGDGDIDVKMEA